MTTREKIVKKAIEQIGNVGGEKYWKWYGFSYRVAWCACWVSWVLDQVKIPRSTMLAYCYCPDAVNWAKNHGIWKDRNYKPEPGDVILFDWQGDGVSDHTGIVEKSDKTTVYTIEGNSSDTCRRRTYRIGQKEILGYAVPKYTNTESTKKPESGVNAETYTVKRGDTLSVIAKNHGVTVKYLAQLNNINDPNVIITGQILMINSNSDQVYTVKKGDNLTKIATAYKVTVEELVKWNKIKDKNMIDIGQKILIKGGK